MTNSTTETSDEIHRRKLDVTPEEFEKIKTAMKDEKFRELFHDYVKEISDPENKKRYEEEISALEADRGNNIRWVKPIPGIVLKTTFIKPPEPDGVPKDVEKVFINVCQCDEIAVASPSGVEQPDGKTGQAWSIPYSLTAGRPEVDHAGKSCFVYDCVYHPETFKKGSGNAGFQALLINTALDGIEKQFTGVKLDRSEVKATVIRTKMSENESSSASSSQKSENSLNFLEKLQAQAGTQFTSPSSPSTPSTSKPPTTTAATPSSSLIQEISSTSTTPPSKPKLQTPNYTILHSGNIKYEQFLNTPTKTISSRPDAIVVKIELPGISSAAEVELDVTTGMLELSVKERFDLKVKFPFEVDFEEGSARFDKGRGELVVTLPVVKGREVELPTSDAPFETDEVKEEETREIEASLNEQTVTGNETSPTDDKSSSDLKSTTTVNETTRTDDKPTSVSDPATTVIATTTALERTISESATEMKELVDAECENKTEEVLDEGKMVENKTEPAVATQPIVSLTSELTEEVNDDLNATSQTTDVPTVAANDMKPKEQAPIWPLKEIVEDNRDSIPQPQETPQDPISQHEPVQAVTADDINEPSEKHEVPLIAPASGPEVEETEKEKVIATTPASLWTPATIVNAGSFKLSTSLIYEMDE
ncbi:Protein kintoun [Blyttiomyces sp. JEL0837]|nr:Protein kintoun [Blyttiomyces sp. JEL0837]